jgi:protein SCO1
MNRSVLTALAATLVLAACGRSAAPVLQPGDPPSDFSVHELETRWTDQTGSERTLASFAGGQVVLAMVYTRCTHTCPSIIAELKRVEAGMSAGERRNTRFVLVSLDPDRDTPERMREWAASLRLSPERWTLLTRDRAAVRELAALIGIRYRPEAGGEYSHSNAYLVLDAGGRIVHRQQGLGTGGVDATLAAIRRAPSAAGGR